jgi:MFS transporter, VNT family, synaptic vesicle glycoprotein 2
LLHFGTFAIGGGMALFLPDVLNRIAKAKDEQDGELTICEAVQSSHDTSNSTDVSSLTCDDSVNTSVFVDSAIIGFAYLVGFILISVTIKPFGRRKLFIFTLLASSISGFLLPLTSSQYLILTFYCLFMLFAGVNVSTINSAACDLFPTHLRAMAVCMSMLFGRLGSVASSNFIGFMIDKNCELTYYLYAGLMFICFLASFIIPDSKKD